MKPEQEDIKNCLYCGNEVIRNSPHANKKKFCQIECRDLFNKERDIKRRREWSQKKRGEFGEDKKQCLLCGKWYVQVGGHIFQYHQIIAKEYKKYFDLPFKRGIIPEWYRVKKAKIAIENGTAANLPNVGKHTRYKKNDERAKIVSGWKGRGLYHE